MTHRNAIAVLASTVLLLSACTWEDSESPLAAEDPETQSQLGAIREPNTSKPQWVSRHPIEARPDIVIVYVHGIFGDTLGTWKNAQTGKHFYDLVAADPRLGGRVDQFTFGFPSSMVKRGSFRIQESAVWLYEQLRYHEILTYKRIVFVTHSMGGLVSLRTLLSYRELLPRVPLIVFFGTPQEGSQIATIARRLINNPALEEMLPADHNSYLQVLNDDWRNIKGSKPGIACAYEKLAVAGVTIVPWESATRFCDGSALAIPANHIDIVKPSSTDDAAYVALFNALGQYVLNVEQTPEPPRGSLGTPDFVVDGDRAVLTINDPRGKRDVRILNSGPGRLRYVLEQFPERGLYVTPGIGPRFVDADGTDVIQLIVGFDPQASDFQFLLTSSARPPLHVTVHIENLTAVAAFQEALAASVFDSLLSAATENELTEASSVLKVTAGVVGARFEDASPATKWLVTAQLLDAVHWPSQTALALREAEKAEPQIAYQAGLQRFAGSVAYLSGEPNVLSSIPRDSQWVLAGNKCGANSPERNALITQPQLSARATALASALRQSERFAAIGHSLQGDIWYTKENFNAAAQSYATEFGLHPTPSAAACLADARLMMSRPSSFEALDVSFGSYPVFLVVIIVAGVLLVVWLVLVVVRKYRLENAVRDPAAGSIKASLPQSKSAEH